MTTALDALEQLIAGNRRYVAGQSNAEVASAERRQQLVDGQSPIAVVIGCSDSRVPVELIFNQGLGNLFVIRVAGNVIASTQIGSTEFAVKTFGTRLVVVLGHTRCGAVVAVANSYFSNPPFPAWSELSLNEQAIFSRIHSAQDWAGLKHYDADYDTKVQMAVRRNIKYSTESLLECSAYLNKMVASGELMVIGAEYDIESGEVEFFDRTRE